MRGRTGDFYSTTAYFSSFSGDVLELEQGECDCPVGFNCKHVAALVLTVAEAERSQPAPARGPRTSTWEQSLNSVLTSHPAGPTTRTDGAPLAVELTLAAATRRGPAHSSAATEPAVRVLARLVTPGKNGWVGGGLSWTKLGSLHHHGGYVPAHVRLLREIYAVYRSDGSSSGYYSYGYSYGDEKSIELSAFESHQLWPMLDEAEAIGVQLVHARKRLGAVEKYSHAEFCLDVTSEPSGMLVITPVIRIGGNPVDGNPVDEAPADAAPIRFIGSEGHGVVCIDRTEVQTVADHGDWHLRMAKLARPVPAPLQRMAVERQRLEIPAAEQARFRDEYYPRLRHTATVISSDESFTPPPISDPTLILRASYGGEHDLDVSLQWAYEVGDSRWCVPLDSVRPDDGYRDPDAERAVLADLDLPLETFGLRSGDPDQPLVPRAAFSGIDTMRFTTEVLPLLADRPGFAVEVTGDPADYREAGDTLSIGVSTDDVAGETDWFDLGVSITVEGREVPFTDVFLALSSGQSHLLLADGAYFALDKPELRTLTTLIEEARALGDSRGERLRISRFQAGLWDELTELGTVHHQATAWQQQVQGLLSIAPLETTQAPETL
ncbi:MAG: SWIM zinc finger family protein, partial [Pseudonocardiaceae bacterium]